MRRRGGEDTAADGGPDAFAREITGQPRRVPDEAEAGAGETPRRLAAHDVRVSLEGIERHPLGHPAGDAQHGEERVAPLRQAPVIAPGDPDAHIDEVALGKEPAVAAQVGLHIDLGRVHEGLEPRPPLGGQPRLGLLRRHHLLAGGHLAQIAGHRAAVATGSDHQGRLECALLGLDAGARGAGGDRLDAHAPAHVGPRRRRTLEEEVIEFAADDAVGGGPPPVGVVARTLERQRAGGKALDGERVLVGLDLEVGERDGRHPTRADLLTGEDGGVQYQRAQPGASQSPGRGAPAGSASHHEDVVAGHDSGLPEGEQDA